MRWILRLLLAPIFLLFALFIDYPRIDRWRRPLIKLPDADEEEPFTRVTTVAKLSDEFALSEWKMVMVAGGAAFRPDLVAQVAANWPRTQESKKTLADLAESLKEAGGGNTGANYGDALHKMLARIHQGEDFRPPPPWDRDINAVLDLIRRAELETFADYVEQTVILPEYRIAGSFDLLTGKSGQLYITDNKFGQDLSHSWLDISIQLALYSRAVYLYDWETRTCSAAPVINQEQGLVIHCPAGSGEASLYVVDLVAGWQAARLAIEVREWRNRRDLARQAKSNGKG